MGTTNQHTKKTTNLAAFPHVARWASHIKSYTTPAFPSSSTDISFAASGASASPSVAAPAANDDDDSDDDDLFGGSDEEEDPEEEAKKAAILKEYWAKKKAKGMKAARSSIELAVKPWDDTTDMEALTAAVLSIEMDGLKWGSHKLKPVGYGINMLVIVAVVEDDKVSTDDLDDKITAFEDFVQSMDVLKFNKI